MSPYHIVVFIRDVPYPIVVFIRDVYRAFVVTKRREASNPKELSIEEGDVVEVS